MELHDILEYYKRQGAPADQNTLIALLTEIQQEYGGSIPKALVSEISAYYGTREALLLAIIRRIPRLRLSEVHTLELCAGPNCGKAAALARCAEALAAAYPGKVTLRFVPCMRLCGKGPNLRFDGKLYHQADESMLKKLMETI